MKLKTWWFLAGAVSMTAICAFGGMLFYAAAEAVQPAPTSTPLPPTYTPWPTYTPIPTETPTPKVERYLSEVAERLFILADSSEKLGTLLTVPRPIDNDWILAVIEQAAIIQVIHVELVALDVPPEMTEIHSTLLDATSDYYTAMNYLVNGMLNSNVTAIATANALWERGTVKLDIATKMLGEYLETKGDKI